MNIAILLAGPYRGNPTNLANHIRIVGNYDTYVSCFEQYTQDWIESNWPIKELFTTPLINFNETSWSKQRNDGAGQSGFWQFWNLKSVVQNTPANYDWYIKSRCDLNFKSGELSEYFFSTLEPNTIYTSIHRLSGGPADMSLINDQFYIADYNTMKVISEFVTDYYNVKRHECNDGMYSNERNLTIWLNENGVIIKTIQDILYDKNHNGINRSSGETGFQLEKI